MDMHGYNAAAKALDDAPAKPAIPATSVSAAAFELVR